MTLREFLNMLFPYRQHLNEEIDYLREQLAQKQRRIDVMQDALVSISLPSKPSAPRDKPAPLKALQPIGIEAVRAARRENPPEPMDPIEGPFRTEQADAV